LKRYETNISPPKSQSLRSITIFLYVVASPEGLERVTKLHPDVDLFISAIDDSLNEKGYILPGLGDAGERFL